jgi:hypothetical protein
MAAWARNSPRRSRSRLEHVDALGDQAGVPLGLLIRWAMVASGMR